MLHLRVQTIVLSTPCCLGVSWGLIYSHARPLRSDGTSSVGFCPIVVGAGVGIHKQAARQGKGLMACDERREIPRTLTG